MTPERMAGLVGRWVRFYTRDLPAPVAERRVAEIDADLHDHIEHERAGGIDERRIARGIASRMVRGVAADITWRGRQAKEETMQSKPVSRSAVRVALGVALVLLLPLIAMLFTDDVVWSYADFVLAGILLATIGVAIELALRRAGNLATAVGIAILGVAAGVIGAADDAPGMVLLGMVLVAGGCAVGVRALRAT
jgi:hypothetical protein